MKRIAFILICVLLCSGCASVPMRMYEGYERSSSQTAIIKGLSEGWVFNDRSYIITITQIDDQDVRHFEVRGDSRVYEVLPGIHTVKFYVAGCRGWHTNSLYLEKTIDAKAGHQYQIRASGLSRAIKVTIIDTLR